LPARERFVDEAQDLSVRRGMLPGLSVNGLAVLEVAEAEDPGQDLDEHAQSTPLPVPSSSLYGVG